MITRNRLFEALKSNITSECPLYIKLGNKYYPVNDVYYKSVRDSTGAIHMLVVDTGIVIGKA